MIHLPRARSSPSRALTARLLAAAGLVLFIALLVYVDRDGYQDTHDPGMTLLDCFYYTVVTLSTTGYGDITPVSPSARFLNVLVVTPARVLFLIILVGTTLEVLTEQYRTTLRLTRWRRTVKDHVIVCGYGTKGRGAVSAMLENGFEKSRIVVVERDPTAVRQATEAGLVTVEGSSTQARVLERARVRQAKAVIIATKTDDSAVSRPGFALTSTRDSRSKFEWLAAGSTRSRTCVSNVISPTASRCDSSRYPSAAASCCA